MRQTKITVLPTSPFHFSTSLICPQNSTPSILAKVITRAPQNLERQNFSKIYRSTVNTLGNNRLINIIDILKKNRITTVIPKRGRKPLIFPGTVMLEDRRVVSKHVQRIYLAQAHICLAFYM